MGWVGHNAFGPTNSDVRSLHRAQFCEAVDVLISTIDWWLDEQSLQPASTVEQLLTNASDRSVDSAAQDDLLNSVTTYHPHLDSQKLKSELLLLAEYNRYYFVVPGS